MKQLQRRMPFAAFTLIELIVVIVILAILATISFISIERYISTTRDSKRVTNASIIAAGFDMALTTHFPVDNAKTSTGKNIAFVGTSLSMTGYYGPVNKELLQSIKVLGNDIANYDGFQEYRYSYFPDRGAYQIMATLENSEYSKIGLVFPSVVTTVYAETGKTGYPFIKGNFANTGGINNIIVSSDVWDAKTPDANGIKVFSGSEAVNGTGPIVVAPPSNVPVDGECGTDNNTSVLVTPVNLCTK